jgi:hypothetical protein
MEAYPDDPSRPQQLLALIIYIYFSKRHIIYLIVWIRVF